MTEIHLMTNEHKYWNETIFFAEGCSWKAGPFLAKKMQENEFKEWERVCAVCENGKVVGFSTFTEKDELSDEYHFTPFIGFVFVDEQYRGKRLSEMMIQSIFSYAKELGYEKVYILSGEIGLYEKYGFVKLGDYETIYGSIDQLFVQNIDGANRDIKLLNQNKIISMWAADMYDLNETDMTDVRFALELIGTSPKKVLDVACGSGRFLVPLAKSGHKCMGLDFDDCMLEKIPAKLHCPAGNNQHSGTLEYREDIAWRKSDVIQDTWGNGFDIVLLAANLLMNIVSDIAYDKAQEHLIRKSSESLVSEGHLFVDYNYTAHPEKWYDDPAPNLIWEGTDSNGNVGKMILLDSSYDRTSRVCTYIRRYAITLADGSSFTQDIPEKKHIASLEDIHQWLSDAGFSVENEWGDYNKNPIDENTNRAIIWARKR